MVVLQCSITLPELVPANGTGGLGGSPGRGRSTMKRKRYTAEFKAKVALEAIQGEHTIAEPASRHALHPNLIGLWKKQAVEKLARVFDDKAGERDAGREAEIAKLHAKIGELVVERDFLSRASGR